MTQGTTRSILKQGGLGHVGIGLGQAVGKKKRVLVAKQPQHVQSSQMPFHVTCEQRLEV